MKSVCVFCGSSLGNDSDFSKMASDLGETLAEIKTNLVYGGANVGLMGVIADAVLSKGGKVFGVIPRFLKDKEVAHPNLTQLILCDSMHERKTKMFELSEGFIAMPGGFGTLEEVSEILTWQQLGFHHFPIGFLNINGFFNHLRSFFDEMERKQLLKPENRNMALFGESVPDLLKKMRNYEASGTTKWIHKRT